MVDYRPTRRRRRAVPPPSRHTTNIFLWSKLLKFAFFALIAFVIAIPIMFLWISRDLPTPGKLVSAQHKDATRIYDRNGVLLYSVYQDENRYYVKLADISPKLQEATIAIEDKNFYTNSGFSITGYLRSFAGFILSRRIVGGGSTITQQLVKNVLLSPEQTAIRKVKELILSVQVDQRFSKKDILEMYLNNIPYGGTAIGVEAASEMYFGKKAKDLDLGQAAFLAGLPQSPSVYSPFTGNKYYIDRTKAVLKAMVSQKEITQDQSDQAIKEIENYPFSQKDTAIKAPHFVMYVKQLLAGQFGEQAVETGGLQVTTTLDYDIEQHAEDIVKNEIDSLKVYKVSNGAAMVTDPRTGQILAMVGSKDYFAKDIDGNFNAAVSGQRQPGSSLKPIIYATAFEKGYTPATMLMDVKTDFYSGDPSEQPYSPVNYDGKFRGPVQIRFALGNSLNIPAVKTLALVGIKDAMQNGYDMGITNWEPTPDHLKNVGLSLVLGGRETTLYDEMTAYGTFANKGVRQDLVSILKVTDSNGKTLYENKPKTGIRVLNEGITFLISHILLDNNARVAEFGPNSALRIPGKTVSVKTGTTDEKRDNWTMGYTPSYVVGVWVGNNDNSPMNQAIASGITGASPIWNKIMTYVLKNKPDEQFPVPSNVTAMQIDSFAGGLPHAGQPTRSEYFIKGTEPTAESPIYKSKDGKNYLVIHEDDPVSKDGKNRWQEGIDAWIQQNHAGDELWNPPQELKNWQSTDADTPTPTPQVTDTPTPTPTPTPAQIFKYQ